MRRGLALVATVNVCRSDSRTGRRAADPGLSIARGLELPFCPRELASSGGGSKLVVADAFGGRLAVVKPSPEDRMGPTIPRHNIRGMAFAPDGRSLVIAHQISITWRRRPSTTSTGAS